jgi:hypothetical protein
MTHDSTWLDRTRVLSKMRLTTPIALLLACMLLAALPAVASATATDVRGEWSITMKAGSNTLKGTALISKEADFENKFASSSALFEGILSGSFSGTLEGSEASVTVITQAAGPFPEGKFVGTKIAVETGVGSLSMKGSGTFTVGTQVQSGTIVATQIRTYKQIEEQEAREKQEREELEARAAVRGEWELVLNAGPQTVKGTALITATANTKNEFASSSALFESAIPGSFSGTLKGKEASVTVITQAAGPFPEGKFVGTKIAVESNDSAMSGSGIFTLGANEVPGTIVATRIKTYRQIEEREKEAREKQEKEAQEATEKTARELKERELKERELKERQEREARVAAEKAAAVKPVPIVTVAPLVPVEVGAKTLTVSHAGAISLGLINPGGSTEHGHLVLTLFKKGKGSSVKSSTLSEASFSIAPHGTEVVKLKLSKSGRAQFTHHKSIRVLVAVTTQADGQPDSTKSYTLTLRAAKSAHGKH